MNTTPAIPIKTIILALIVVGLIALVLGGYLAPVSRLILNPVVNVQSWLAVRYQALQNIIDSPQDLVRLRQRNSDLEAEVSRLQAEVIALKQQLSETQVLSALVDFARVQPENRYLAATVIGRDPSPFVRYVIINRGSDDGHREA